MKNQNYTIENCFNSHKADVGELKYTLEQMIEFWLEHKVGDQYKMFNRDKSFVICKVTYYPLPHTYDCVYDRGGELVSSELKYFNDLRALVEIDARGGIDFREVPIHYLERMPRKDSIIAETL